MTGKAEVEIVKTMYADGTKVINFDVVVNLNNSFTDKQKEIIEEASTNCSVVNGLYSDKTKFRF